MERHLRRRSDGHVHRACPPVRHDAIDDGLRALMAARDRSARSFARMSATFPVRGPRRSGSSRRRPLPASGSIVRNVAVDRRRNHRIVRRLPTRSAGHEGGVRRAAQMGESVPCTPACSKTSHRALPLCAARLNLAFARENRQKWTQTTFQKKTRNIPRPVPMGDEGEAPSTTKRRRTMETTFSPTRPDVVAVASTRVRPPPPSVFSSTRCWPPASCAARRGRCVRFREVR